MRKKLRAVWRSVRIGMFTAGVGIVCPNCNGQTRVMFDRKDQERVNMRHWKGCE